MDQSNGEGSQSVPRAVNILTLIHSSNRIGFYCQANWSSHHLSGWTSWNLRKNIKMHSHLQLDSHPSKGSLVLTDKLMETLKVTDCKCGSKYLNARQCVSSESPVCRMFCRTPHIRRASCRYGSTCAAWPTLWSCKSSGNWDTCSGPLSSCICETKRYIHT